MAPAPLEDWAEEAPLTLAQTVLVAQRRAQWASYLAEATADGSRMAGGDLAPTTAEWRATKGEPKDGAGVNLFHALEIVGVCALIVVVVAALSSCLVITLRLAVNGLRSVLRERRRRRRRRLRRAALAAALVAIAGPTAASLPTTVPVSSVVSTRGVLGLSSDDDDDDDDDASEDENNASAIRSIRAFFRRTTTTVSTAAEAQEQVQQQPGMSARRLATSRQWLRRAVTIVTKTKHHEEAEKEGKEVADNEVCAICLEMMEAGQRMAVLPCQHALHAACAWPWLVRQPTCPTCRQGLTPLDAAAPPPPRHVSIFAPDARAAAASVPRRAVARRHTSFE